MSNRHKPAVYPALLAYRDVLISEDGLRELFAVDESGHITLPVSQGSNLNGISVGVAIGIGGSVPIDGDQVVTRAVIQGQGDLGAVVEIVFRTAVWDV